MEDNMCLRKNAHTSYFCHSDDDIPRDDQWNESVRTNLEIPDDTISTEEKQAIEELWSNMYTNSTMPATRAWSWF